MLSLSIQPSDTFRCPSFPSQKPSFKLLKASTPILDLRSRPITRIQRLFASAASTEIVTAENTEDPVPTQETEEVKVVVKQNEKPRLVLKFIWMEKNIGLALDQVIPGHGTIPLSPYYFWPRKDAWEELKATLETKPWISQKKTIILLNQATDIINLWQQSGGNLSQ